MSGLPNPVLPCEELDLLAIVDDGLNGSMMGGGIPVGDLDRCLVILFRFGSDDCWLRGFWDISPGFLPE